jgi:hypothetical protein
MTTDVVCRSRYVYEGHLWRCRMPVAAEGQTCQAAFHITDMPLLDDDVANVLTWEDFDQVPIDLVDVVEQAEAAAPSFDWQLYLGRDPITGSREVEVIGTSRAPLADVDAAAQAAFPGGRFSTSFVDEGYAIVFGDADLPTGEHYGVQLTSEVPGHTGRPWEDTSASPTAGSGAK